MKFTTSLTLFSAFTGAYALSHKEKRTTPLTGAMSDITAGVSHLHEAAETFNGNIDPVVASCDKLIERLSNCQQVAETCDPISLGDAISLISPCRTLDRKSKMLVKLFKDRIDDVKVARACNTTRQKMTTIAVHANKLTETIVNKMTSPLARSTAKKMTGDIKTRFDNMMDAFSEKKCPI
ncbi:hypothetical protein E4U47_008064 [Claviceps purpurea]|nr:hypothetical protein E4U28_004151 [Claviceps purpurea]KAG6188788.1 hypothetical protein E4U27_006961 [Claviceps purpurea]KAG6226760.1 hypothetical protein E4U25_007976 [Claviceps purpurea]KAG6276643.1 hypothetical protein E4U47_008064 [Claviceps purpurea]